ncbi:MAG: helix-turn-helix domain-containing protein [Ignavibacteriales bacterium]
MDINQAAKVLKISTKTLRKYIKIGTIEARLVEGKTGKEWNLSDESIEEFKRGRVEGVAFPGLEKTDKTGVERVEKPAKVPARMEKRGTVEAAFQGVPISLGPPRASEPKRYLDSLPDILDAKEVAEFLGVSQYTIRGFLKEGTLHGVKLGKGWKVSKGSLEKFVRELLG